MSQNRAEQIATWITEKRDQVLIILGIVIFLIVLIPLIVANRAKAKQAQWEMLAQAQSEYYQGNMGAAVTQADGLLTQYKDSTPALYALFFKGNALYHQGKYNDAMPIFQQFYDEYKKHPLAAAALDSLGYCNEMTGKYNNAAVMFGRIIDEYPESYLLPSAYLNKARCLELSGDMQKAQEAYQLVMSMFPSTMWSVQAQVKLTGKLPEINEQKTN